MVDLGELSRWAFERITNTLTWVLAKDRRRGIQGVKIAPTEGESGPELLIQAEGMQLRFWASKHGPGCVIQGAPVIGFLWSRWTQEQTDRCIGVFVEEQPGEVAWLTMAKGDLPSAGLIDIHQAAVRSGADRLVELTWDVRFHAKIRAIARELPRSTPKAVPEDEIGKGEPR